MASSHEKSYELLPHDSVAIQHHHDHGRPSHDEACLALAGLPNQAYWSPPPPIPFYPNTTLVGHFGLYHNDTCVNNNHCFVNGSDGANQRVLTNLQQPLSSGQSQCQSQPQSWHWESDPNIGSMAEDEASRATDFCDGKCSQDGAMCKDTCHGDCEDADKELCDPGTSCFEQNCSKPRLGPDVAHGVYGLQKLKFSGTNHSQQTQHHNLQSACVNSSSTHGFTAQPGLPPDLFHELEPSQNDSYRINSSHSLDHHYYMTQPPFPGQYPLTSLNPPSLTTLHGSNDAGNLSGYPGLDAGIDQLVMQSPQQLQMQQQQQQQQQHAQIRRQMKIHQRQSQIRQSPQMQQQPQVHQQPQMQQQLQMQQQSPMHQQSQMQQQPPWSPSVANFNLISDPWSQDLPQVEPTDAFDFNNGRNGHYSTPMSRQYSGESSNSAIMSPMPQRTSMSVSEGFSASPAGLASVETNHQCLWVLNGYNMGDRICGETFESNAKLHHHVAEAHIKHMQNDPHNGFVCGWHECIRPGNPQKLGFEGKSKLKRHIITHVGPAKVYPCPHPGCTQTCNTAQALRTHEVTHSDERPHRCEEKIGDEICGKTFKTLDSLRIHKQNKHSSKKRYYCKICNRSFKDSSNFSKHKKIHFSNKEWKCNECNEAFVRRDQLFRHAARIHHMTQEVLDSQFPKKVRGKDTRRLNSQQAPLLFVGPFDQGTPILDVVDTVLSDAQLET